MLSRVIVIFQNNKNHYVIQFRQFFLNFVAFMCTICQWLNKSPSKNFDRASICCLMQNSVNNNIYCVVWKLFIYEYVKCTWYKRQLQSKVWIFSTFLILFLFDHFFHLAQSYIIPQIMIKHSIYVIQINLLKTAIQLIPT